jgi:signal transduction histidine kinase
VSKIFYIGFGEIPDIVQNKLSSNTSIQLSPIIQLSSDIHKNTLEEADVFLIGPLTINVLQQVQRAYQQNPLVSIIVLAFPEQYQQTKQSIQFGHNVGKNTLVIPYQLGKDISEVLESAIKRTQQRRSFVKIQERTIYPLAASRDTTFHNLGIFLENAPIGAIVFNKEKKIISANLKAKQFFGRKLDLRYHVKWSDLFPGEDYSMQMDSDSEPIHEIIKVNNQFLEINISPFLIENNKPHYLLLINDITRAVDVENQLKSKIEELEFLNRELDEFINVVSHDFKTPLTSIGLLTDLALKESSSEKLTSFLTPIKRNCNKLKDQLKGLTTLVDIKKKRSEKVEMVNFQQILNEILSEDNETLKEINGKLISDFSQAPEVPYFTAHINSLLSNLINNTIKYRRQDVPLLIEVSSRKEKDYTVLTVKDNGIGIDLKKNLNLLFQPFKRLTEQSTGSGLGLSIVKRIIEQNHGYLEVFSEIGKGTEFKTYLKNINTED